MSLSLDEAKERALKFKAERHLESIFLEPAELPQPGAYGFDPEGWAIFVVIERNPMRVGGPEYVAVNYETGEVRTLGVIGE